MFISFIIYFMTSSWVTSCLKTNIKIISIWSDRFDIMMDTDFFLFRSPLFSELIEFMISFHLFYQQEFNTTWTGLNVTHKFMLLSICLIGFAILVMTIFVFCNKRRNVLIKYSSQWNPRQNRSPRYVTTTLQTIFISEQINLPRFLIWLKF